jgi:hypothetical protein
MRDTVSCTSAGAGRTGLPWGRQERQADGSPAGGHPRFFWQPLSRRSAPRPTIRLHPMRDPANRTLARTCAGPPPGLLARPRLRQIAYRVFVEAGSDALAAGRPRRAGGEDGGIGVSQKMRMAPCRASLPLPFPTRPRTRGATPARRRALTPFHCIAGHLVPGERDAQFATQSAMDVKKPRPDAGSRIEIDRSITQRRGGAAGEHFSHCASAPLRHTECEKQYLKIWYDDDTESGNRAPIKRTVSF